ncbi:MAG: hypothetical protein IKX37_06565 [Bacteroidales bacterium]|nr:hypothetical protein [Bacteroidales bacterium]
MVKRFLSILLSGLLLVSCGLGGSDALKVNIDRALKHPAGARDVYAEVVAIPLLCPVGTTLEQAGPIVLDVAADRFFLLDAEKNEILVFDWNGEYVTAIASAETILDFSVYQDETLEVLTQNAITEYAVADGSFQTEYLFENKGVALKCLGRVDDDSFFMLGSKDGFAYGSGYIVGGIGFYSSALYYSDYLTTHAYAPAAEVQNSRFFRCGDSVYSFLSQSGEIQKYEGNDFACVPYQWDLGKRQPNFTNVQKTANRLYLAFESEGECTVLIYNLKSKQYKAVPQSEFPLGVIYDGCNYAFARGEITRQVLR